ncbi:hypothetical protein Pla175_19440 [Pirellulimonas nuda]|uniref:DUF1559 domain-containing protein n=1 Tax=Pirellulimonas nuda TaxID=2528009 RepID=A0A518DAX2_9BACT|nr:DUF1559 domain-containing protein [Pirellulimonas nuda]QDU88566.1 hypothetical protein Pla175_19440 [Pirellulimonas nuda]
MKSSRTGFTLVELLVVIAIIGVLVAMLLPAVQAAREAARRSSCNNNLRQMAIALHNHHDTVGYFPSGWKFDRKNPDRAGWGWNVALFPYMEQRNIFDAMDVSNKDLETVKLAATAAGQNNHALLTVIPNLRCPSDTGPDMNEDKNINSLRVPLSNYVACHGLAQPLGESRGLGDEEGDGIGVFYGNSKTKMEQITDGTSKTLALGERSFILNGKAAVWAGVGKPADASSTFGTPNVGGGVSFHLNGAESRGGFRSLHPGGAQFVFADCSVHFISDDIESNIDTCKEWYCNSASWSPKASITERLGVYQRLGMMNDGLVVGSY